MGTFGLNNAFERERARIDEAVRTMQLDDQVDSLSREEAQSKFLKKREQPVEHLRKVSFKDMELFFEEDVVVLKRYLDKRALRVLYRVIYLMRSVPRQCSCEHMTRMVDAKLTKSERIILCNIVYLTCSNSKSFIREVALLLLKRLKTFEIRVLYKVVQHVLKRGQKRKEKKERKYQAQDAIEVSKVCKGNQVSTVVQLVRNGGALCNWQVGQPN